MSANVLLSTKVAPSLDGTGFEPDRILDACPMSLEQLGVDRVDMYLLHFPATTCDSRTQWTAMRGLVDDGLVCLSGLSNFDRDQMEDALPWGLWT